MDFLSTGWIWLYIGAGLMLAEILSPGLIIFFFGLGAATVGALWFLLPQSFHLTLAWQLALFCFFSLLYLFTLRRYARGIFGGDVSERGTLDSDFVGRRAHVVARITPEAPGRILLGDAEWSAEAQEVLEVGTQVRILANRNLTMQVEKI